MPFGIAASPIMPPSLGSSTLDPHSSIVNLQIVRSHQAPIYLA